MTRLEELYQMNNRLTEELKPIQEKHKLMEGIISLKEKEAWERMFDDCMALVKYKCVLDTGIIAVNQVTYGFVISSDGKMNFEYITHQNGRAHADSYNMTFTREKPYKRSNEGWSSTDSHYIREFTEDVIKHWDIAYQNIQDNIARELELRMKEKIEKSIQNEERLSEKLMQYGITVE